MFKKEAGKRKERKEKEGKRITEKKEGRNQGIEVQKKKKEL